MALIKQPLVPKVIIHTNDETTPRDSSSENVTSQNTRKARKKWKDAGLLLPANKCISQEINKWEVCKEGS